MPGTPHPFGANANREEEKKPALGIRTMRSDIAEFLKTAKPSLLELGVRPSEFGGIGRGGRARLALKIFGFAIILGVLAAGGFLIYQTLTPPPPAPLPAPPPPPPPAPQPLMFFESVEEVTILRAAHELERALDADLHAGPPGEFNRIVVRIPDEAGTRQVLAAREFFALLAASPPAGFLTELAQPPQFFIHASAESDPALGILFPVSDPPEALRALGAWEPRLAEELAPLLTATTTTASPAFASASYRNIPYRFRKLEPERGRGIGYFAFPAKNLAGLAASEETLKRTIDRMFEGR